MKMCQNMTNLCDAKLTSIVQSTEDAAKAMQKELPMASDSDFFLFLNYKYVIIADGNSAPSSRLSLQIFFNSLILLQETSWFEAYYIGLRPFVHYVPVSENFEDLKQKIIWCQNHQTEVIHIIQNAKSFAWKHLNSDEVMKHFESALYAYTSLLDFQIPRNDLDGYLEVEFEC